MGLPCRLPEKKSEVHLTRRNDFVPSPLLRGIIGGNSSVDIRVWQRASEIMSMVLNILPSYICLVYFNLL